ncbi:MAG: UbiD family decarboxylase [Saprospiraceae bacterium]|nr:UbiD family decarboxylase [Saprospiraceae bacterium]
MIKMSLESCLNDLQRRGELLIIKDPVDPNLEMAEIHRRIYNQQGPAILFENIIGSPFKACSNIYGTNSRCSYIFQDAIKGMEYLIKLKINPSSFFTNIGKNISNLPFYLSGKPILNRFNKEIISNSCKISDLPQIVSWPKDGGAFITLPQVITFPPGSSNLQEANIGMYRIQISGNRYIQNKEIGLHYQLHRGIGIHHQAYLESNNDFNVSIGVGGSPAHALGSIFPLPEGLSEILFTGLLNNRSYRYFWHNKYFIPAEVDFCITGKIQKNKLLPEGPFGDHLGYYSLEHEFPVIEVENVFHKKNPIWHFTVVGRPPQEDSGFGFLIHQMVKEISKNEFPGVKEIHAVDVAGVHPLLLAIGSERYMPFREKMPEEILTQANHILGKGQTSLAKYLFITTNEDDHKLDIYNIPEYFKYILERIDWSKDLHFQTNTTIDTLDYSGSSWNAGSKLVIACNRIKRRVLSLDIGIFNSIQSEIKDVKILMPGVALFQYKNFSNYEIAQSEIANLCLRLQSEAQEKIPLIVLVDDIQFCTENFNNFIWVCFTRSNPSHDIYGVGSFTVHKHWGCNGPLIIDARLKPHHAPVLEVDQEVSKKADKLFSTNKELHKFRA